MSLKNLWKAYSQKQELRKGLFFKRMKGLKPPAPNLDPLTGRKIAFHRARSFSLQGRSLSIGGAPFKETNNVISLNIAMVEGVNIVADGHCLPFKDASFETVFCNALLMLVQNPYSVLQEAYRVLKPGGLVYSEVPFIFPYHPDPHDFHRFTMDGLRLLFRDFQVMSLGPLDGPAGALFYITREFFCSLSSHALVRYAIKFLFNWLFFPMRYGDLIMLRLKGSRQMASGFYILCKKADGS